MIAQARERLYIDLLRWAPKRTFASVVGTLARRRLPRAVRRSMYTTFANRVGADLSEVALPLEEYATLDDFFTRQLRAGVRPIDDAPEVVISPCDGTISEHGETDRGRLVQAKGIHYPLWALLGDRAAAERFEGGTYVTIYLAPRDYHRVHFAAGGTVTGYRHVAGALFPVNAAAVRHVDGLFAKNERLITYQDSPAGEVATVMVGATAVGQITVTYDAVATRLRGRGRPGEEVRFGAPHPVERGGELGTFHLGSTVILVFQPGRVRLGALTIGQRVRMGEPIARLLAPGVGSGDAA